MPHVLVTGACGYIGSHACVVLLEAGYDVTAVDNLVVGKEKSIGRVRELVPGCGERLRFQQVELCDAAQVEALFAAAAKSKPFDSCIHFAGLKAVGESVAQPLMYFQNNLGSTLTLLEAMKRHGCKKIIFSSSATVYGSAEKMPITEETPTGVGITNPYGRTKYMIEEILQDFCRSPDGKDWSVALLRYFNPVGAHKSGNIGEDPKGIPNNLMPYVAQVAVGKRPELTVFGNDYPTPDGTGVRDYIHVVDLADGHLAALRYIDSKEPGCRVWNLGTGKGSSVIDMVKAMEKASGKEVKYKVGPRRPGDVAVCYADPAKAETELGWKATRTLEDMCADLWRWQQQNPEGYGDA
eukprot:TRINITY_DN18874_c4_g1_i1.p1 TRINITY_DN18874_c4_g1~~TRINITY_DN18874_c4_g1_i1.p1  ORF type:complete len:352 (+),score=138.03 TRINITY_DN18874_c4_g1_i1:86-1141(+)